ncbi:MAG: KH domain-containing protein [Lachnospiraceae bacterium]|jgi:conserved domain protein|nr:MAG: KH domain-containing protein [Lachnospiraceae bacterium]
MKEIVELIAKALVDKPEEVVLTETIREDSILIELSVAESDMGKIIGRSGKIAKAIRSIVKAATSKSDKKVILEIR